MSSIADEDDETPNCSISVDASLKDISSPLDFDLKAALITSFLNCDPKLSPHIPSFRISELLRSCTAFDGKRSAEFHAADSVLSLYILCINFALSTHYDSSIAPQCFSSFMTWLAESMIVDDILGSNVFSSFNLQDAFVKNDDFDVNYKYEIFMDSLDMARNVLRETYSLCKNLKQHHNLKDEALIPKNPDCIRPTTLYFMISFALCHIVSVLHAENNLSLIPGLVETLVLMIVTSAVDESQVKGSSLEAAQCVRKAHHLARYTAHYTLTPRVLKEVILVKGRVKHVLKASELEFVLYRTSAFKDFAHDVLKDSSVPHSGTQFGSKMDYRAEGFHIYHKASSLLNSIIELSTNKIKDDEDSVDQSQTGSLTSDNQNANSTKLQVDGKIKKIIKQFRALKRAFRLPFVTLHASEVSLHPFLSVFDSRYKLKPHTFPPGNLSAVKNEMFSLPASQAAVHLESVLFTFSRAFPSLPRVLNPKQEAYWISLYLIEHLYKLTYEGLGFCPSPESELKRICQQLKESKKQSFKLVLPIKSGGRSLEDCLREGKTRATLEARLLELEGITKKHLPFALPSITKLAPLSCSEINTVSELLSHPNLPMNAVKWGREISGGVGQVRSVVWHSALRKDSDAQQRILTMGVEVQSDNPYLNLPGKAAALEYAKRLEQLRAETELQQMRQRQRLIDLQEEIVAKNRARKFATLRSIKDKLKEDIEGKNAFLTQFKEMSAQMAIERDQTARREAKAKEEADQREQQRIQEIKLAKIERLRQEEEDYKLQLQLEKSFISKIVDEREATEIVRRIREEERMRYLEEKRRTIEEKNEAKERQKEEEKKMEREKALSIANKVQARLRQGNFVWHNGKYSYYDNVRRELKDYIQLEDTYGRPYYYDPIYNTYQFRHPTDGGIKNFVEEQRKEYDAIHGEGAYAAYMADIAFKDSVNKYGGYYNEVGEWVIANGYYDKNYNWIEHEGYFDDQGKYVRYAKISGDLNFMV